MRVATGFLAGVVLTATIGVGAPAEAEEADEAQLPPVPELPADLPEVPGLPTDLPGASEILACLTGAGLPEVGAAPDPAAALAPLLCVIEQAVAVVKTLLAELGVELPDAPVPPAPGLPAP